jgi:hypothetical protein
MSDDKSVIPGEQQEELRRLKLELADQFMDMARLEAHIAAKNRSPTNLETMKLADYRAAVNEARDRIVEMERITKSD